jgi:hypothetical protein
MSDEKKNGGFLKSAFKLAMWTVPIFLGVTFGSEILTFAWAHENPGGQALMKALNPVAQNVFDNFFVTEASLWAAEQVTSLTGGYAGNAQDYADTALGVYNNMNW